MQLVRAARNGNSIFARYSADSARGKGRGGGGLAGAGAGSSSGGLDVELDVVLWEHLASGGGMCKEYVLFFPPFFYMVLWEHRACVCAHVQKNQHIILASSCEFLRVGALAVACVRGIRGGGYVHVI